MGSFVELMILASVEEDFHLEWTKNRGAAHMGSLGVDFPTNGERSDKGFELNYHRLEAGGFVSRLKARLRTACSGILNPEIVVVLRHLLRPDVLHDDLVGHVPRTRHEEPPGPQVPSPAELLQMAELLHQ